MSDDNKSREISSKPKSSDDDSALIKQQTAIMKEALNKDVPLLFEVTLKGDNAEARRILQQPIYDTPLARRILLMLLLQGGTEETQQGITLGWLAVMQGNLEVLNTIFSMMEASEKFQYIRATSSLKYPDRTLLNHASHIEKSSLAMVSCLLSGLNITHKIQLLTIESESSSQLLPNKTFKRFLSDSCDDPVGMLKVLLEGFSQEQIFQLIFGEVRSKSLELTTLVHAAYRGYPKLLQRMLASFNQIEVRNLLDDAISSKIKKSVLEAAIELRITVESEHGYVECIGLLARYSSPAVVRKAEQVLESNPQWAKDNPLLYQQLKRCLITELDLFVREIYKKLEFLESLKHGEVEFSGWVSEREDTESTNIAEVFLAALRQLKNYYELDNTLFGRDSIKELNECIAVLSGPSIPPLPIGGELSIRDITIEPLSVNKSKQLVQLLQRLIAVNVKVFGHLAKTSEAKQSTVVSPESRYVIYHGPEEPKPPSQVGPALPLEVKTRRPREEQRDPKEIPWLDEDESEEEASVSDRKGDSKPIHERGGSPASSQVGASFWSSPQTISSSSSSTASSTVTSRKDEKIDSVTPGSEQTEALGITPRG